MKVNVGVGMGVVVGGRADVVRGIDKDCESEKREFVSVMEYVGSEVPESESERVFRVLVSLMSDEIEAVPNEIEGESVGIIEKVKLGVKCVSESVGGIVLVSVGLMENVMDKAESVKEFVMSAVSDLEAELAESVTSGVSESERERESDTDREKDAVGSELFDCVGSLDVV
jgi:hypothetical protein